MTTPCSVERLESALAGRLPNADETLLYQHLEECAACAASLECLAGGKEWSRETAALLKTDELDSAVPIREEWSPIDFTVEHLEPTDEPNLLGRLGGYDILEIIGHGGMGVVLKAFDRELKRCVAIKVLAPHLAQSSLARKRFAREAQAAAAVVHPNVLAIHQVQPNGRLPFLVMPFIAGESLAQRLAAQGALELKEILRIGMQAAAGLAAAHEQGLVHRDVKPANILLEKGIERAVLTDFGLARAADDVTLTRWGVIAGTPQYMSPEQARGEPLDNRSDLFSLGCVLYETATGVSPFRTDSMMATLRKLVEDSPQALASLNPELPPWFIAIVDRLLEKDPAKRFNTAQEVSDLLEGCLAHIQQPTSVPLPSALPRPVVRSSFRKFIGRYKGVLTMLAALAVGAFAMLMAANSSPEIAGEWSGGEEWGRVVLKQTNSGEYSGSYSATTGKQLGEIQLKWSRIESRFNGSWREGEDRFGELSVRLVDDQIRGALTTDAKSKINPATPRLADLTWVRAKATATATKSDVPWGDWNGGWSVRLRPAKTNWAVGELPEFTVDLRKRETGEPDAVGQTMHNWRLDVDGQRFNLSIRSTAEEHKKTFEPGTALEGFVMFHIHRDDKGLEIRNGENRGWGNSYALQPIGKDGKILSQAKPEESLKLTPGKHIVRVAFPASPVPPAGEPDELMAISNPVEIEIGNARNAAQSKASFEPVVERTMPYGHAIDFLSGRTMEWPEKWRNESHTGEIPDEAKWIVDAGVAASAYGDGLVGHGTVAAPCPHKFEEVTVEQVMQATADLTLEKNDLMAKKDGPNTLFFRTREGTKGILQIVDLGNKTTGLKLRYKLVQDIGIKSAISHEFGPVIERPIGVNGGETWALNIASGKVVNSTPDLPLDFRVFSSDAIRAAKVDLYAPMEASTSYMLKAVDMLIVPLGENEWDASPSDVAARLETALKTWQLTSSVQFVDGRKANAFRTREGAQGVFQVVNGPTTLRYKLLKFGQAKSVSAEPSANTSNFGPVIEREIPSGKACLNLVTDKLIPLPEFTLSADEVRKLGGDLFQPGIENDKNALTILDMGVLDLDVAAWDKLSASALEEKFAREAAGKRASQRRSETRLPPGVYGFKTHDKTGILQVLGMNGNGVKVRYKLLQANEQRIGEPLRVPVRKLETEIKVLSIPYDEKFKLPNTDSIELDWASVVANPQAVVFTAPRILALNGQESAIETASDNQTNPQSHPIIKIYLLPTIDGQTIQYSAKLSLHSKQTADKGERTTTHELKLSGDAKLDQPQMIEIGRGGDNRRYLAWIQFHLVDAAHLTTFGPVLERVVTDPLEFDHAKSLILDTADWENMPAEELAAKMAAAEKIDIRASANSRPYVDLSVALAALLAEGKPATPLPHSLIWAFKTPQGSTGILQVTGFTANPRGVKIRSKLVQVATPCANAVPTFESVKTAARKLISQHYPEAVVVADTEKYFKIQHDTREHEFASLGHHMGEKTGPNAKGFMLSIRRTSAGQDALATPQISKAPYGETFVNKVLDPHTGKGAFVYFSYATELDAGFKAAMMDLLKLDGSRAAKMPPDATFGPVRERVVKEAIDLDTGNLLANPMPDEIAKNSETDPAMVNARMRERGLDAYVSVFDEGKQIWGQDLKVKLISNGDWDITPEQLQAALNFKDEPDRDIRSVIPSPAIFAFQTREGSMGMLQNYGPMADGSGIKIRYKLVQQAGKIQQILNSSARLQFRLVADQKDTNAEILKRKDGKGEVWVSREVLLDETSVSSSSVLELESGWSVSAKFTEDGAKKLAEVTAANVGKQLAIVFDGKLLCEPSIVAAITGGSVQISGNFSADEADALAKAITIAIQSATSKHSAAPAVVGGKLSEKSQKIVDALLANSDDLRIVLGRTPQDRPDRHDLLLSTNQGLDSPDFVLRPRVTNEQMQRVLTLLAASGYFDRADGDFFQPKTSFRPTVPKNQPGYLLNIIGCENHGTEKWNGYFSDDLSQREGADLEVVKILLAVLDGDAGKAVRTILAELAVDSVKSAKFVASQGQIAQIDAMLKKETVTTGYLANLYESTPGSAGEFRLRKEVEQIPILTSEEPGSKFFLSATVYQLPASKSFYVQWDNALSSTHHYYGPFYGEPAAKLGLKLVPAAENRANAVPVRESKLSPERTRTINLDTRVGRISCSPDGKLFAVANDQPTMILLGNGHSKVADNWQPTVDFIEVESGKKLASLQLISKQQEALLAETERAPLFQITALAFSPDSKLLAVGTSIGQVKLFAGISVKLALDDVAGKQKDTHTPAKYRSLERAMGAVTALAFSPDGSLLAVGGESFADVPLLLQDAQELGESTAIPVTAPGRLKLWEVQTGKLQSDLLGHSDEINAVAFSADGKSLASAGRWHDDKEFGDGIKIWDPASGELKRKIDVLDNGGARSVAFSPDSNLIAIGTQRFDTFKDTRSGGVQLIRVASGILDWSQTVSEWANPVLFTQDGQHIIVLSGGHSLNIIETKTGKIIYDIHAEQERWNTMAIVPAAYRVLIGGVDAEKHGFVGFWNLIKETPQVRIPARYSATKEQVARIEVLLHTSHTPITREHDPEVYELKPGAEAAKQYQLRSDVVKIPVEISDTAPNDTRKREIYHQQAKRNFYLRWDGSGIKPQQCYGPYDEMRFHDFGLTPVFAGSEKKEAATEPQRSQFGQMSERVITEPTKATPGEREKRFLDLDEGDYVEESPKGDLSFSSGERRENNLVGWNLVTLEVSDQQWAATADEVRKALADKKAESKSFLPYKSTAPTTYFFKTNFGSIGKLQLEKDANKPGTVTVRFYAVSPTPMFGGYANDGLDEEPEELEMQGDWKIVSIKGDPTYRWRMMKVGDSLRIPAKIRDLNAEPRYEDQYRLSDSKLPLQFDVTFWVVNLYATQHGIFKFEGDKLILCVAPCKGARPTEFVAEPEKSSLFVLKRVTPAKPSAADSAR